MAIPVSEFTILGRVGKISSIRDSVRISIRSDYGKRANKKDMETEVFWNEVVVYDEELISTISDSIDTGDLVTVNGTIREIEFEKFGEKIYSACLAAKNFVLLEKQNIQCVF